MAYIGKLPATPARAALKVPHCTQCDELKNSVPLSGPCRFRNLLNVAVPSDDDECRQYDPHSDRPNCKRVEGVGEQRFSPVSHRCLPAVQEYHRGEAGSFVTGVPKEQPMWAGRVSWRTTSASTAPSIEGQWVSGGAVPPCNRRRTQPGKTIRRCRWRS